MNSYAPHSLDAWRDVLRTSFGMIPVVGVELEWYLQTHARQPVTAAQRTSYIEAWNASMPMMLMQERGKGQVEANLLHRSDLNALIAEEAQMRTHAHTLATAHGMHACFDAKPYPHDYGSGMHVHLHLEDLHATSLFEKRGDSLSPALRDSLSGLLHHLHEDLDILAGSEAAKARYVAHYDAPRTVTWGGNNRTVALRLPDGVGHVMGHEALRACPPSPHRRIEHRVPSSEANLASVLCVLLRSVVMGLTHHYPLIPPSYGDAAQSGVLLVQQRSQ